MILKVINRLWVYFTFKSSRLQIFFYILGNPYFIVKRFKTLTTVPKFFSSRPDLQFSIFNAKLCSHSVEGPPDWGFFIVVGKKLSYKSRLKILWLFKIHYFLSNGHFLAKFWKYLGYFLFQHLVTLSAIDYFGGENLQKDWKLGIGNTSFPQKSMPPFYL